MSTSLPMKSPGPERVLSLVAQPKRHSVLVVDDEPGARDSLRLILERDFRVVTTESGEAALDLLARERFAVMTLDLQMPGWGGPETLLKIRDVNAELQVVIVTAYASYTEAMRALRLRAFDLISKPFDAATVVDTVRRAARRYDSGSPTFASLDLLEGLPMKLISSIHELSKTELRSLSKGQSVTLDDVRARARRLFDRLKAS